MPSYSFYTRKTGAVRFDFTEDVTQENARKLSRQYFDTVYAIRIGLRTIAALNKDLLLKRNAFRYASIQEEIGKEIEAVHALRNVALNCLMSYYNIWYAYSDGILERKGDKLHYYPLADSSERNTAIIRTKKDKQGIYLDALECDEDFPLEAGLGFLKRKGIEVRSDKGMWI